MKVILLILLSIINLQLLAQKTERYNGPLYNGIKINGTTSYAFYKNEKGETIKHGSFRYSAREKTESWRYSHGITGEYKQGLKNGKWSYTLASKDYEKDQAGNFFDIEVEMEANYENGVPEGKWTYTCVIKKHKLLEQQGRLKSTEDELVKEISIQLSWDKGVLKDTLKIVEKNQILIEMIMDKAGVLNGESRIAKGSNTTATYYQHGILQKTISGSLTRVNPEYQAFSQFKTPEQRASKTEKSILNEKENQIMKYIKQEIFSEDYFLYRYIDGDKILLRDKQFKDYELDIKGLIYYELTPKMSSSEAQIISSIKANYTKVKQADELLQIRLKKDPKLPKNIEDYRRLKSAKEAFNEIDCQLSMYERYLSIEAYSKALGENCKVNNALSPQKTKVDYLKILEKNANEQMSILEAFKQL